MERTQKNVRAESVRKGKEKREEVIAYINTTLAKLGLDSEVNLINPVQRAMNAHERTKHNKTLNRTTETDLTRAMGLYCELRINTKKLRLILFFRSDHGYFLKIPGEYKNNIEGFLDFLEGNNFYVLTVHKGSLGFGFSNPMSIGFIRKFPHHVTHENRLQFKELTQKNVDYPQLTEENLLGETRLNQLIALTNGN